jgi:hypothetical protein
MTEGGRVIRLRHELHSRSAAAIAAETAAGRELTPGQKATITRRLHREIAAREGYGRRLPLWPAHMASGGLGTGKTTVARRFAAGSAGLVTWITEPTFDKSAEEFAAYQAEAGPDTVPAMLIRGRDRKDPMRPGHFMCDRHKAARRIAEAGLSVPEALCKRCEFRGHCGDHRQRREADELAAAGRGAVFFLDANYAFLPSPAPTPDHAILDESLLRQAVDVRAVTLEDLRHVTVPNSDFTSTDTAATLRAIIEAFTVPHPTTPERVAAGDERIMPRPLAYLRHAGIDRRALRYLAKSARAELERQTPHLDAEMTDEAIEDALDGGGRRQLRQLLPLLSALAAEIDSPRETATAVYALPTAALGVARLRKLRGLRRSALTVLDGTGHLNLARRLFGARLTETRVVFDRQAHIIGTRGRTYSRQSITAEDAFGRSLPGRVGGAAKLRNDIAQIFDRLPAGSAICASKRAEELLVTTGAVHPDTPSLHFGALRGRNAWEHVPGALVVGAENIALADLEAMARAFLAVDPVPFVSMDEAAPPDWRWAREWPYRASRMRDGSTAPVEVPVHPDPRVQDVLELVREDELIQAIDRLRPVWHRRHYALLNDLCLDVTYDAIYGHRHLVAGGNPLERAFLATGLVPRTPADLHRAHPAIFRTEKAAARALENYPQTLTENPIYALGVVFYRRVGQRGPEAKLWLDRGRYPAPAAAIPALEAAIGCKLAAFDGVELRPDGGTPEGDPSLTPQPWAAPEPRQPGSGAAPPSILLHGPPAG